MARLVFALVVAVGLGGVGCAIASRPTDPGLAAFSLAFLGLLAVGLAPAEDV